MPLVDPVTTADLPLSVAMSVTPAGGATDAMTARRQGRTHARHPLFLGASP
jgi:hypothetical protein